ncbi:unnamed protein product [Trichogramma brassicae]|uniref:Uncharacterized protein n=1 Tax=Trichogramma brassicae TaxID=86971 RepID=A0A6H5IP11_9HYME|nr:unnamed protein product [Trichogramma brassicae]
MLIELGDKKHGPVLIDGQDKFGDTPLHLAAREGHKKMTRLLLRNGANPNLTNAKGSTPLHIICIKEDIDEVRTFFELSEDEYWPVQVNVQDELGNTPLHLALNQSKKKVAELLLGRGSDPNVVNKFGSTPLHVICERSHFKDDDYVSWFFGISRDLGRTVRIDARDAFGRTPLERAVASLLPNTIDVLLDNGADLSSFVFPSGRRCYRHGQSHSWSELLRSSSESPRSSVCERSSKIKYTRVRFPLINRQLCTTKKCETPNECTTIPDQ